MKIKSGTLTSLSAILILVISGCSSGAPESTPDSRPHIILIMPDDQGWGDVGYNGHPFVQTPALDAMAAESFVFDRFYAAAPVCSPTRASVLTGRHPIRSQVPNHGHYLRPHEQTLAETLKTAGYVTGIFGKFHIGSAQPDTPCNPGGMGFDEWVIGLNFFDNDPYLSHNGTVRQHQGKGSVIVVDEAISFLRKHKNGQKPIFTVIWFPSPHYPHEETSDNPDLYAGMPHAGYFREITLLDAQIGRLRRELRELGLADNTLLWFCSDNGGLVEASSGGRSLKGQVYEGGLRVPGILEWPARQIKGRTSIPVSTSDIYPTVLSLAGVNHHAPHLLDGMDVSDIIAGRVKERSLPIGFWHQFQPGHITRSNQILKAIMEKQQARAPLPHDPPHLFKEVFEFPQFPEDSAQGHAAWLDWPWKLHRIDGTTFELYNLENDPMETDDLSRSPEYTRRFEKMKKEITTWQQSVVRSLNGNDYQELVNPSIK